MLEIFNMLNYKYKKIHKKKWKSPRFNHLTEGIMGLRVLESCRLTSKQLESIRRVFVRLTKREGRFLIRVFLNQSITKKAKGSRMGKGVGPLESWVIDVKAGQLIFEFTFLNEKIVKSFLAGIKSKIPAKTVLVLRDI